MAEAEGVRIVANDEAAAQDVARDRLLCVIKCHLYQLYLLDSNIYSSGPSG